MALRFKIDTSKHVLNFQDLLHVRKKKENKTFRNEGLDGKNCKNVFFFVAL